MGRRVILSAGQALRRNLQPSCLLCAPSPPKVQLGRGGQGPQTGKLSTRHTTIRCKEEACTAATRPSTMQGMWGQCLVYMRVAV